MTDLEIDVQASIGVPQDLVSVVETAVAATLRSQNQFQAALSCLLTDDAAIQEMNRNFRGEDKPTDVLSFPAGDAMPGMPAAYLGDIAISVPYAHRQAVRAGHSLADEIQLLAVHGVLHVLGFDHGNPVEKEQMWAAQTAVLTQLGLAHVTPTES